MDKIMSTSYVPWVSPIMASYPLSGLSRRVCLVTGIGGSIGCHLLAHIFHNTDWDIVGIDSFNHRGWMDRILDVMRFHPEWKEHLTVFPHGFLAAFSDLAKKKM